MTHKKQQGFILALALLMMLFVGLVVITSTERTGQETRISQSDAPTATLQAAAEAGILTLRKHIDGARDEDVGLCKDNKSTPQIFCDCINQSINGLSGLSALMGDEGYKGSEAEYSNNTGQGAVHWWFMMGNENEFDIDSNVGDGRCRISVKVFVGDPASNPDYFMSANILVEQEPVDPEGPLNPAHTPPQLNNLLAALWGGLDVDPDTLLELLDAFYADDFDFTGNDYISFVPVVGSGGTLLKGDLDFDKLNLILLDDTVSSVELGSNGNSGKLNDYEIIVVSRGTGTIEFKTTGGNNSPTGLVVAPNAPIELRAGVNDVKVSAIASNCGSGPTNKSCDVMAGGGKLSGFDLSDDEDGFQNKPPAAPPSTAPSQGINVIDAESMDMDFNY